MKITGPTVRKRVKSAVFQYSFRIDGKRFQGSTGETEARKATIAAKRILAETLHREIGGSVPPELLPIATLFELDRERRSKAGRADETLGNHKRYAERFCRFFEARKELNGMTLASLTTIQIESWRDWLRKEKCDLTRPTLKNGNANDPNRKEYKRKGIERKLSAKTIKEHLIWLSSLFNAYNVPNACRSLLPESRTRSRPSDKLKYLSTDEIDGLLQTVLLTGVPNEEGYSESREVYHWLVLLAYTGMRLGDAQRIRFCDIDESEKTLSVFSSKTRRERRLNLSAIGYSKPFNDPEGELTELVFRPWESLLWLQARAKNHYGGSRREDSPLHFRPTRWLYKKFQIFLCRTGLPPYPIHSLRHTFVTHALKHWPVAQVAKFVGHEDINVTYKIYGHLLAEKTLAFSYELKG